MEVAYYEIGAPGSYGGVDPLVRRVRTTYKQARNWLRGQKAYTMHKAVRKNFLRRKTYAKGIDDLFQADLVDLTALANRNDSHRYILTCIDVLSKYAWAIPLKSKTGSALVVAFEKIFDERLPNFVQTDRGTEFTNSRVQTLFHSRGVRHYYSLNDDIKAAVVERFNRTLKTKMARYFTRHNTERWIDVLDDLLNSYNRTRHRAIGMAPVDVNMANEVAVRDRLYPLKPPPVYKYAVADTVRISRTKGTFEKGYAPNWSEEIFVIAERHPTYPVTYSLKDLADEPIKGKFYEQEIQRIEKSDDVFEIEKVIKTKRRNGKLEYFVKWKGYPDKFNSWVSELVTTR